MTEDVVIRLGRQRCWMVCFLQLAKCSIHLGNQSSNVIEVSSMMLPVGNCFDSSDWLQDAGGNFQPGCPQAAGQGLDKTDGADSHLAGLCPAEFGSVDP